MTENKKQNKLTPPVSGFFVPVAIVVGGALIIWAITKMLGTQTGYKKLVEELHSKTFGNRWVAAYELSKYISTEQIPEMDQPWLVAQLGQVYEKSEDPRTRNFIVLALGNMPHSDKIAYLNKALNDSDSQVVFNAVVGLTNSKSPNVDLEKIVSLLDLDDVGLQQVSMLAIAQFKYNKGVDSIRMLINSDDASVRYIAATTLLVLGDESQIDTLDKVFLLKSENSSYDENQILSLKLNVIQALLMVQNPSQKVIELVEKWSDQEVNQAVQTKLKDALLVLKNH